MLGKNPNGYVALQSLCERLAIPVVEWRNRANFPGDHPLHQGYDATELTEKADVILVVDHDVPYIPTTTTLRRDARIIQIDIDPVKERIPLWTYPIDLPIKANSALALEQLNEIIAGRAIEERAAEIEARRTRLAERHERQRDDWRNVSSL